MNPPNVHHAQLEHVETVADRVAEFRFRLADTDADLRWRAGQFISVQVGRSDEGDPILRSYSLASRPVEPGSSTAATAGFRVLLKFVPGGVASAWFEALSPGETIRFTGPMGFFVLDLAHPGDVILAATGTGLAPMIPMIEELLERDERGRIHLCFGVRQEQDLFWQARIADLVTRSRGRLSVETLLSQPRAGAPSPVGRITADRLLSSLPDLNKPTFYLCGNGAMIRDVKAGLLARGIDRKRQVRTEAFFD